MTPFYKEGLEEKNLEHYLLEDQQQYKKEKGFILLMIQFYKEGLKEKSLEHYHLEDQQL